MCDRVSSHFDAATAEPCVRLNAATAWVRLKRYSKMQPRRYLAPLQHAPRRKRTRQADHLQWRAVGDGIHCPAHILCNPYVRHLGRGGQPRRGLHRPKVAAYTREGNKEDGSSGSNEEDERFQ